MTRIRALAAFFLLPFLALSGCFTFTSVHEMNYFGMADSGGYELVLPAYAYDSDPSVFTDLITQFEQFSSPQVTRRNGDVVIADSTGRAAMEHFYDSFGCAEIGGGLAECSFTLQGQTFDLPDWRITHGVVLRNDMTMLRSNHDSVSVTADGRQMFRWDFDATSVDIDIRFTVRVRMAG